MPVIRKNYIQPSTDINDKKCELLQDGTSLFSFSSILNVKYSNGRVASSVISQKSARNTTPSSNLIDTKNYIQPSTNINGKNCELSQDGNDFVSFSSILSAKYSKGRVASSIIPQKSASSVIPQKSARNTTPSSNVIDIEQSYQPFSKLQPHPQHRQVRLFYLYLNPNLIFLSKAPSTSTSTSTTTTTTTDTTTTTTAPACYFGEDYVNLVEGGRRQISSLKTGDRVWTISNDGKRLIKDEIIIIPHAGPTIPTYFYTFTTIEGHTVSLTDSHFIVTVVNGENKIKIIRASEVTLKHQLIMAGRTIGLEKIVYSIHIGFYSPITLSGYLTVNNISTSVYVD
ncbi:unnamed protein product [Rotaria sp. Silwood1]|nr:unnamed protein product [Rotaria sp. Silwood1]CAF1641422.1 unnamed protein product [Rotaria sp. Silwood1]